MSAVGVPTRTPRGQLSLLTSKLTLLSPCLHDLPQYNNFQDPDARYRNRPVDMLVNAHVNKVLNSFGTLLILIVRA